jgi:hypothetical protein
MFKFRVLMLSTLLASIGLCASISETEVNGGSSNNTLATAQAIPNSAFTAPAPAGVFNTSLYAATVSGKGDGQDVDFYSFQGRGPVQIGISDPAFTFSTILSLFDSGGHLLAFNMSSDPVRPGSASSDDSYIGTYILPSLGTYYVAVSSMSTGLTLPDTSSCSGFDTLTRPDGGFGGFTTSGCDATSSVFAFAGAQPTGAAALGYTLVIAQTPEPGTFVLMGAGMIALGFLAITGKRRSAVVNASKEIR